MRILALAIALFWSCAHYAQTEMMPFTKVLLTQDVLFENDQALVSYRYDSLFEQVRASAQKYKSACIQVTAHTDANGSSAYNDRLANRRADSISRRLLSLGIDRERIQISTHGERKPVADNHTEAGRQLNRRATIKLVNFIQARPLPVRVIDESDERPVSSFVKVSSVVGQDSAHTDERGSKMFRIPLGPTLRIEVVAKGYFYHTEYIKAKALPDTLLIRLRRAVPGAKMDIRNLYFFGGKAQLIPRSMPVLPTILQFARMNPTLEIEIAGHVNVPNTPNISVNDSSFELSIRRAKVIHDYLVNHGIDATRISYKGYGNWEMRFPKARSPEQQQQNRRVEVRIIGTAPDSSLLGH